MKIDIRQIIRAVVIALSFLGLMSIYGAELREAQQYIFMLICMILFGFLLDNIWISCFLWWTVFLHIFFKQPNIGSIYLTNVFFGCILYYIVKVAFKKEHIDTFINAVLWLAVINLFYMSVQLFGFDWIYKMCLNTTEGFKGYIQSDDPVGFMGFKAAIGMLMAMAIPLLATRQSKWAIITSILFFIPLYIAKASICVIAGVIGLLWVILHKVNWNRRKAFIAVVILAVVSGLVLFYIFKIDDTPSSLTLRLVAWKGILQDTVIHPVTGWGLDSFRNVTAIKKHLYCMNPVAMKETAGVHMEYMDNPHNLYISLMYEWGIIGIIILIGLLRRWGLNYAKAIKESNTIALSGFIIVTLIVSLAQFPLFLSRFVCFIIPMVALWEVQTK